MSELEAAVEWHRAADGGEQALLGECLLAALDAAERTPGAGDRLSVILDDARRNDDAHVEVFASTLWPASQPKQATS